MTSQNEEISQVELSPKRAAFVEAYLETWNASEAARIANYAKPGSQGHRLLKNVEIQTKIKQRLTEMAMGADEVLHRLAQQAKADVSKFFEYNDDGSIKGFDSDYLRTHGHLVKKMKVDPEKIDFELYDGQTALINIGRHHKLFVDSHEIKVESDILIATIANQELMDELKADG